MMKLGLMLDASSVTGWKERFEATRAMAQIANRHGLHSVIAPQHVGDAVHPLLHPLILLARLCDEVDLRLVTGVVVAPLVHPLVLADEVATLDIASGGRVILGVGAGHRQHELMAFGIERSQRGALLEACVAGVRQAWQQGVVPVQHDLPIWVAGTSDRGVERAARIGDAWYVNPGASTNAIVGQLALYDATLEAHGKTPPTELPVRRDVYLLETRADRIAITDALRQRYEGHAASSFASDFGPATAVGARNRSTDAATVTSVSGPTSSSATPPSATTSWSTCNNSWVGRS